MLRRVYLAFIFIICVLITCGEQLDSWQDCDTFLAPSTIANGGWGVFAGRDFAAMEIVDVAPLFLPADHQAPILSNSILHHYTYGYLRWNETMNILEQHLAVILFGNGMVYNHHHLTPNVKWSCYGREPTTTEPHLLQAVGFVARRPIVAREELFSSYGEEDNGKKWFEERHLEMIMGPQTMVRREESIIKQEKNQYCSLVYSGMSRSGWNNRVMAGIFAGVKYPYQINSHRLSPWEHTAAVVKRDVTPGTVLEIAPALVMEKSMVRNTLVAPYCFFWNDWDETQQQMLKLLREDQKLYVHYQGPDSNWTIRDNFHTLDDIAILPFAGSIALVERVGSHGNANCELQIISATAQHSTEPSSQSISKDSSNNNVVLRLVATKHLVSGERLKLGIASSATSKEIQILMEELTRTGQDIPNHFKSNVNPILDREEF
jgi:hypothetical protein